MFLRTAVFFICLVNMLSSYSQTDCDCAERFSNLAELKSFEKKPDSALILYKKSMSFLPLESRDYWHEYRLASYFAQNNELDSSAFYLIKAIQGGYNKSFIEYSSEFDKLMNSKHADKINGSYRVIDGNFDWDYYNKLQQLLGIDQVIRRNDELSSFDQESRYRILDSIVFMEVMELINLNGYPQQSKHGFYHPPHLFFMHASMYSEEQFQYIVRTILKANKSCLSSKGGIAVLSDRRLDWHYEKTQVAGTWNYENEFKPIEDLKTVDSIRFSYNLLRLSDFAKMTYRVLPEGYTPSPYPENYFCDTIVH